MEWLSAFGEQEKRRMFPDACHFQVVCFLKTENRMAAAVGEDHLYDAIVIGAGFSGLACGAGLRTFGIDDFVILERGSSCGHFWKTCTYDRLHLHTPYHDLPHDQGLVYRYPKYKSRSEVVSYLNAYADLHRLPSKIMYNSNVLNINKSDSIWDITYTATNQGGRPHDDQSQQLQSQRIRCKYLVIATSTFRCKSIPQNLSESMAQFNGEVIHSMDYKNASKYEGLNMLVVGNGNSGCEICIDAVEHGVGRITMVSRRPRHFIPLSNYERGIFRKMAFAKWIGVWDRIHSKLFKVTKQHRKWKGVVIWILRNVFELSFSACHSMLTCSERHHSACLLLLRYDRK